MIETYTSQIDTLNQTKEDFSRRILDKKADRDDIRLSLDEAKAELRSRERDFNELREDKYKLESKLDRSITSRDNLQANIFERYSLDYQEALEYREEGLVIDFKHMEALRKKIKSIGNVNLEAIVVVTPTSAVIRISSRSSKSSSSIFV